MSPGGDLEWHEQVARRIEAIRHRPLRISDLIGAVVVSAVVLGLARFARDAYAGPSLSPTLAWLAAVAVLLVLGILGVVVALGLGRLATALYQWGQGGAGLLAWAARGASVLADLVAIGLLMAIALGATLFLVMSAMILMMSSG